MFSVSRKPTSNQAKPTSKLQVVSPKAEDKKSLEDSPAESSIKKVLENSNSSKNSPDLTEKKPSEDNREGRRIKIRLSIIKDVPYSQKVNSESNGSSNEQNAEKKMIKRSKEMKMKHRRVNREGNFNCGRWQMEEHERFIEAIMKYGNEWKSVQRHVGSRSSTQARSHAQKFFVKMKKANLLDLNLDLSKNSIKTLHEIANSMNSDEYYKAIKALNCVAFDRKNTAKRRKKEESDKTYTSGINESSVFIESPLKHFNNDDIFSLNTNDNSLLNVSNPKNNENSSNYSTIINTKNTTFNNLNLINGNCNSNTSYQIKFVQNEQKTTENRENQRRTKKNEKNQNVNTIIINNNINTYNYNVNINNYAAGQENKDKNDNLMHRKRNRINSFDIFNYECGFTNRKFDEKEYIDHFNCTFTNVKSDYDIDKEIKDLFKVNSEENSFNQMNGDLGYEVIFDNEKGNLLEDFMFDFNKEKNKNFDI